MEDITPIIQMLQAYAQDPEGTIERLAMKAGPPPVADAASLYQPESLGNGAVGTAAQPPNPQAAPAPAPAPVAPPGSGLGQLGAALQVPQAPQAQLAPPAPGGGIIRGQTPDASPEALLRLLLQQQQNIQPSGTFGGALRGR